MVDYISAQVVVVVFVVFYNHNFDGAQVCNISFESSFFTCTFQEKYFLNFVVIFLELKSSCWYIIGMNSDRIKFKLLLQLKKTPLQSLSHQNL